MHVILGTHSAHAVMPTMLHALQHSQVSNEQLGAVTHLRSSAHTASALTTEPAAAPASAAPSSARSMAATARLQMQGRPGVIEALYRQTYKLC